MDGGQPALTLVLALTLGVVAQSAARHLHLPGIVVLLLAGAALGPDGLGWVNPRVLGEGLYTIVDLAVAVILFEGGLNLEISRLRREQKPIRRLVTLGALVTLLGGAVAVRVLLHWDWVPALLFGGLVVVTGPTVIGPLVHDLRLRPRVARVLEAEGVLIDPIGAILAVLLLGVAMAPDPDALASGARAPIVALSFGALAGALAGFALAGLLRVRRLVPEGHANIFVLAAVLLLFEGCSQIVPHSGLLAVTLAGVVVGNLRTRVDRDLREFKDQITVLLIGLLFVLLAADVRLEDVRALGWQGLAVVGALVLVVRPVNVALSTAASELSLRERVLIGWLAPRGIVAAAVAAITAAALERRGLQAEAASLRALVFLTIAGTVLLAGLTGRPVASLLRLRLPGRETVAILGAQGLGLVLAEELREGGTPVVFLDSNPHNCRRAEERGFQVVFGDALQERTLLRARFEAVGAAVGATPNQMLNSVFANRARELFRVPKCYVAAERPEAGLAPELVRREEAEVLFEGPHDAERWDVRSRQGQIDVERWVFRGVERDESAADGEAAEPPKPGERMVFVAIRRGRRMLPVSASFEPQKGDVVAIAIHRPEREEAHAVLRELGWEEQETEAAA
ncbi:MAG: cation:proton antiporter [Myxococcota bacterium]